MEIKVKIRFNASKQTFETYGMNKYLIYLPFPEDGESEKIIATLISRKTGTPESRVIYKNKDAMGNWVFELT